jgi:hypothetical protein
MKKISHKCVIFPSINAVKKLSARAKALDSFCGICGTAEAVPFQNKTFSEPQKLRRGEDGAPSY